VRWASGSPVDSLEALKGTSEVELTQFPTTFALKRIQYSFHVKPLVLSVFGAAGISHGSTAL
jgi:hypothetical protein